MGNARLLAPAFSLVLKYDSCCEVGVAQLAEHWVVAPVAVGSNPITHPILSTRP